MKLTLIEQDKELEKKTWFRFLKIIQIILIFIVLLIVIFQISAGFQLIEILGMILGGLLFIKLVGRAIVYIISGK